MGDYFPYSSLELGTCSIAIRLAQLDHFVECSTLDENLCSLMAMLHKSLLLEKNLKSLSISEEPKNSALMRLWAAKSLLQ